MNEFSHSLSRGLTAPRCSLRFRSLEVLKAVAVTAPSTVIPAPVVTKRTPPVARTANWLLAVELKEPPVESAHTNAPWCTGLGAAAGSKGKACRAVLKAAGNGRISDGGQNRVLPTTTDGPAPRAFLNRVLVAAADGRTVARI